MLEKNMKKEIMIYLKPVKELLACSGKSKRKFYSDLISSAEEYRNKNPHATRVELYRFLGTPQELVMNFMDHIDEKEIKWARRRSLLLLTAGLVAAALLVLLIVYLWLRYTPTSITTIEIKR